MPHAQAATPAPAMQQLDETDRRLGHLSASCDAISDTITGSHSATAALLERSDHLAGELAAVQRKAEVVQTFLEQYQLDPADAETLKASDIDEAFFKALARVQRVQVRGCCLALRDGPCNHHSGPCNRQSVSTQGSLCCCAAVLWSVFGSRFVVRHAQGLAQCAF